LARLAGVTTSTIRYYEEQGLLNQLERSPYIQRRYNPEDLYRLRLIRRAKSLGLSLKEIRELVEVYRQDPTERKVVEQSIAILQNNCQRVERKMEELVTARQLLSSEIARLQTLLATKLRKE
jgi:MerR family Zn(II)-responsive transcriptional regulator of zntA